MRCRHCESVRLPFSHSLRNLLESTPRRHSLAAACYGAEQATNAPKE